FRLPFLLRGPRVSLLFSSTRAFSSFFYFFFFFWLSAFFVSTSSPRCRVQVASMANQEDIAPPAYSDEEKQDDKQHQDLDMTESYGKGDPFGDETNAEVKYKSMSWW